MTPPPFHLDTPILILGGGINGAATARELTLNGYSVTLVDQADIAGGATAYSSRLIHGGLRYLEYGEFDLVKESLAERTRLLQLAESYVHPLRLFIPAQNRWGGLWQAGTKFFGLGSGKSPPRPRGLNLIRLGLRLYDTYVRDQSLPQRSIHALGEPGIPQVSSSAARWLAAYSDGQIPFPERFVIALLRDAQQAAEENGCKLQVLTYHRASLRDGVIDIAPSSPAGAPAQYSFRPAAIINATGAWVDDTLARLPVPSRRLMGGTKGSHFFTWNARLKELLGGNGVYTEAPDGRPVFLLPLVEGTLVGTTDIPYSGDPALAIASSDELNYLLEVVHAVFPQAGLAPDNIAWHYSGVRPLPYVDSSTPAAVTRRHALVWNDHSAIPLVSLVGGKLTTCRSLAQEAATVVLKRLGETQFRNSQARVVRPGLLEQQRFAESTPQVTSQPYLAGTRIPISVVRRIITQEWVARLEDLVERRLMLLYQPGFSRQTLAELAGLMVQEGKLTEDNHSQAAETCRQRLKEHFGFDLPLSG